MATIYGGSGFDNLNGTGNDDLLYGFGTGDDLFGGGGTDTFYGGSGDDYLYAGSGGDTLFGGTGSDDRLYGGGGGDTLYSGDGADRLYGGSGDDLVYGEGDDDSVFGDAGDDSLYGGDGADRLYGGVGNDLVYAGVGEDQVHGGDGADRIEGGTGDDKLFGEAGADTLDGQIGNDTVFGGTGDDVVSGGAGADLLYGGDTPPTVSITTANVLDTASGFAVTAQNVSGGSLTAPSASNIGTFSGTFASNGAVSDVDSGTNNQIAFDKASGLSENVTVTLDTDTTSASFTFENLFTSSFAEVGHYAVFDDGVLVHEADFTESGAGSGSGTVDISGFGAFDTIVFTALLQTDGTDGSDYGISNITFAVPGASADGNDTLFGGDGDDDIFAGDGADLVYGGTGADTIQGGAGNDTLDGQGGADLVYAGDGADRIRLEDGFGSDTIYGGEGGTDSDTLDLSALGAGVTLTSTGSEQGTLSDGTDTAAFFGIENVTLTDLGDSIDLSLDTSSMSVDGRTGDDTITGANANTSNDTLSGGAGNDALTGLKGADTLFGGTGNDTLDGGDQGDTLYGGDGDDAIEAGEEDAIGDDDLIYAGAGEDTVTSAEQDLQSEDTVYAGSGNDTITMAGGTNTLFGGTGNDLIQGGNDRDIVFGGADGDSIAGGDDIDVLYGGDGSDQIDGGNSTDTIYGGDGTDSIADTGGALSDDHIYAGSGDDTVAAGQREDTIYGGTGNDTLSGEAGEDVLFGGGGNDTITGGAGNDTLTGGTGDDVFKLSAGGGNDTASDFGTGADQIDSSALSDIGNALTNQDDTITADEVTVTGGSGSDQVLTFPSGETLTVPDGTVDQSTPQAQFASLVAMGVPPCFAPGTSIRTTRGEVLVEDLRVGDLVITADHGPQSLLWIGRRDIVFDTANPRGARDKPILISAGSLGNGLPRCNLVVSPQHRIVLSGDRVARTFARTEVLARAKALTVCPGIRTMNGRRRVTYHALLFARHEIIFAEGAPTESFRPGPVVLAGFSAEHRSQIFRIYPGLAEDPDAALGPPARPIVSNRDARQVLKGPAKLEDQPR